MFRLCWKKLFNHLGTEQYLPVYYAVQEDSTSVDEILVWPLKWKLLSSTSLKFCLLCCTVSVQGGSNFSVCENLEWCDHWNESQRAVLLCGTVYYALHGCSNFLYFLVKTKVRRLSMHIYIPGWLGFSSSSLTLSAGPVDELLAELCNHG